MEKHETGPCKRFGAAMEVLAKPWTGLILVTLEPGALRFRELGDRVGAIGDRMLSLRLRDLEARGLIAREVLPGPPVRVEYSLTETGRGFQQVAGAMEKWGGAILAAAAAAPPPPVCVEPCVEPCDGDEGDVHQAG